MAMSELNSSVPDGLEGDHATTDPVWADFHDIYLACNSAGQFSDVWRVNGKVLL